MTTGARFGWVPALLALLAAVAQPAAADWRDEIEVFRVGVLVGDNPTYRIAQLEPFRRYMEDRLGVPVELFPASAVGDLIDAQADGRVDYAVYSASSFAAASHSCGCVEPVAVPLGDDGSVGYHAIALALSDGPIKSLADAKGLRLAVAADDSIAGRLLPLALFAADGMPAESYFADLVERPDPEAAVRALLDGEADLALAWSTLEGSAATGYSRGVLRKMVSDGTLSMAGVRVVWQSPLIPYGPHAIRSALPDDLKAALGPIVLDMAALDPDAYAAIDRTGGVRLVAIEPSQFEVLDALFVAGDDEQ